MNEYILDIGIIFCFFGVKRDTMFNTAANFAAAIDNSQALIFDPPWLYGGFSCF
jgi:hypothetical protein